MEEHEENVEITPWGLGCNHYSAGNLLTSTPLCFSVDSFHVHSKAHLGQQPSRNHLAHVIQLACISIIDLKDKVGDHCTPANVRAFIVDTPSTVRTNLFKCCPYCGSVFSSSEEARRHIDGTNSGSLERCRYREPDDGHIPKPAVAVKKGTPCGVSLCGRVVLLNKFVWNYPSVWKEICTLAKVKDFRAKRILASRSLNPRNSQSQSEYSTTPTFTAAVPMLPTIEIVPDHEVFEIADDERGDIPFYSTIATSSPTLYPVPSESESVHSVSVRKSIFPDENKTLKKKARNGVMPAPSDPPPPSSSSSSSSSSNFHATTSEMIREAEQWSSQFHVETPPVKVPPRLPLGSLGVSFHGRPENRTRASLTKEPAEREPTPEPQILMSKPRIQHTLVPDYARKVIFPGSYLKVKLDSNSGGASSGCLIEEFSVHRGSGNREAVSVFCNSSSSGSNHDSNDSALLGLPTFIPAISGGGSVADGVKKEGSEVGGITLDQIIPESSRHKRDFYKQVVGIMQGNAAEMVALFNVMRSTVFDPKCTTGCEPGFSSRNRGTLIEVLCNMFADRNPDKEGFDPCSVDERLTYLYAAQYVDIVDNTVNRWFEVGDEMIPNANLYYRKLLMDNSDVSSEFAVGDDGNVGTGRKSFKLFNNLQSAGAVNRYKKVSREMCKWMLRWMAIHSTQHYVHRLELEFLYEIIMEKNPTPVRCVTALFVSASMYKDTNSSIVQNGKNHPLRLFLLVSNLRICPEVSDNRYGDGDGDGDGEDGDGDGDGDDLDDEDDCDPYRDVDGETPGNGRRRYKLMGASSVGHLAAQMLYSLRMAYLHWDFNDKEGTRVNPETGRISGIGSASIIEDLSVCVKLARDYQSNCGGESKGQVLPVFSDQGILQGLTFVYDIVGSSSECLPVDRIRQGVGQCQDSVVQWARTLLCGKHCSSVFLQQCGHDDPFNLSCSVQVQTSGQVNNSWQFLAPANWKSQEGMMIDACLRDWGVVPESSTRHSASSDHQQLKLLMFQIRKNGEEACATSGRYTQSLMDRAISLKRTLSQYQELLIEVAFMIMHGCGSCPRFTELMRLSVTPEAENSLSVLEMQSNGSYQLLCVSFWGIKHQGGNSFCNGNRTWRALDQVTSRALLLVLTVVRPALLRMVWILNGSKKDQEPSEELFFSFPGIKRSGSSWIRFCASGNEMRDHLERKRQARFGLSRESCKGSKMRQALSTLVDCVRPSVWDGNGPPDNESNVHFQRSAQMSFGHTVSTHHQHYGIGALSQSGHHVASVQSVLGQNPERLGMYALQVGVSQWYHSFWDIQCSLHHLVQQQQQQQQQQQEDEEEHDSSFDTDITWSLVPVDQLSDERLLAVEEILFPGKAHRLPGDTTLCQLYRSTIVAAQCQCFVLPCGSGKSAGFLAPVAYDCAFRLAGKTIGLHSRHVVVVVVPYLAVGQQHERKVQETLGNFRFQGRNLSATCQFVRPNSVLEMASSQSLPKHNLYVFTVESFLSGRGVGFVNSLSKNGFLRCVVFDEAHLLLQQSSWRTRFHHLRYTAAAFRVPLFLLTATLPPSLEEALWSMVGCETVNRGGPFQTLPVFRANCGSRSNVCYVVDTIGSESIREFMKECADKVLDLLMQGHCVQCFVMTKAQGGLFLEEFKRVVRERPSRTITANDVGFLSGGSGGNRETEMNTEKTLDRWVDGTLRCLVSTSAGTCGVDNAKCDRIVHLIGAYDLTSFEQASGRGGRAGQPTESIVMWNYTLWMASRFSEYDENISIPGIGTSYAQVYRKHFSKDNFLHWTQKSYNRTSPCLGSALLQYLGWHCISCHREECRAAGCHVSESSSNFQQEHDHFVFNSPAKYELPFPPETFQQDEVFPSEHEDDILVDVWMPMDTNLDNTMDEGVPSSRNQEETWVRREKEGEIKKEVEEIEMKKGKEKEIHSDTERAMEMELAKWMKSKKLKMKQLLAMELTSGRKKIKEELEMEKKDFDKSQQRESVKMERGTFKDHERVQNEIVKSRKTVERDAVRDHGTALMVVNARINSTEELSSSLKRIGKRVLKLLEYTPCVLCTSNGCSEGGVRCMKNFTGSSLCVICGELYNQSHSGCSSGMIAKIKQANQSYRCYLCLTSGHLIGVPCKTKQKTFALFLYLKRMYGGELMSRKFQDLYTLAGCSGTNNFNHLVQFVFTNINDNRLQVEFDFWIGIVSIIENSDVKSPMRLTWNEVSASY